MIYILYHSSPFLSIIPCRLCSVFLSRSNLYQRSLLHSCFEPFKTDVASSSRLFLNQSHVHYFLSFYRKIRIFGRDISVYGLFSMYIKRFGCESHGTRTRWSCPWTLQHHRSNCQASYYLLSCSLFCSFFFFWIKN